MDTHYMELYNDSLLQITDNRFVFGKVEYTRRVKLPILDWNEHVDRQAHLYIK